MPQALPLVIAGLATGAAGAGASLLAQNKAAKEADKRAHQYDIPEVGGFGEAMAAAKNEAMQRGPAVTLRPNGPSIMFPQQNKPLFRG